MAVVSKIFGSGCMEEPVNTNPAESCRPKCLQSPGDTNESLQGCKGSWKVTCEISTLRKGYLLQATKKTD